MRGRLVLAAVLLGLLVWGLRSGRGGDGALRIDGQALGTGWRVTVVQPEEGALGEAVVRERVEAELELVDRSMSTWRDDSELAAFARLEPAQVMPVSDPLAEVLDLALEVARRSEGAFDPTVGPLVRAWGFGPDAALTPPSEEELALLFRPEGWRALMWNPEQQRLGLSSTDVELDLSAVAKGYAVDRVADALAELGAVSFLVEVGGELVARGTSPRGDAWSVAIETPAQRPDAAPVAQRVVPLVDRAIATSGDYRNVRLVDGQEISHTIDPRTGKPVTNGVGSVSVLAPTCALADALATAVLVLGPEAGIPFLETWADVDALLLVRDGEAWVERYAGSEAAFSER